jgi:hypothetical protein
VLFEQLEESVLKPFAEIPPPLTAQFERGKDDLRRNLAPGEVQGAGGREIPNLVECVLEKRLLQAGRSAPSQHRNQPRLGAPWNRRARKYHNSEWAFTRHKWEWIYEKQAPPIRSSPVAKPLKGI